MSKSTLFLLAFCLYLPWAHSQTGPRRQAVKLLPHDPTTAGLGAGPDAIVLQAAIPFASKGEMLACSVDGHGPGAALLSGNAWMEAGPAGSMASLGKLVADEHSESHARRFVSRLFFLRATDDSFRIVLPLAAAIDSLKVHFYDPGITAAATGPRPGPVQDRSACPCTQPQYQGRADWCPEGDCPTDPTPVTTVTGFLIVHHSAGTNTATDWAAVVRAIWDFHVNVNGWDDIGYNWLIDPNGVLYEGRGDNRQGAHFCGTNPGTMGVCVLGDFTSVPPQPEAITTLDSLLAWKACDAGLNPLGNGFHGSSGLTLQRISGHRDGCATACPGNALYPLLPGIRQEVSDFIENECTASVTAPTLLSGVLVNNFDAVLDWEDNSDNETGFELERSVGSNADFQPLATLPADSAGYSDTGLSPQTSYYYRVRAVAATASSDYSNVVSLTTGPSSTGDADWVPGGLRVSPNPVRSRFLLTLQRSVPGALDFQLSDAAGKLLAVPLALASSAGQMSYEVDMTGFPDGMYWLKVTHAGASRVLKILKVN